MSEANESKAMDKPLAQRLEMFGGPMDGDHRTTTNTELFFECDNDTKLVHAYLRTDRGLEWQGLQDYQPTMKVYVLKVGQRS